YYRIDVIFSILLAVFTISSNLIFIKIYGIEGAALASLLSFFVYNLLKMWFVKYKFGLLPFNKNTVAAVFSLCGIFFIGYLLRFPNWNWIIVATAKVIIIGGLYLLSIWFLPISEDLKNSVKKLMRK
ncbi:MAG: lipopolysaccharide biosynthesis protein, partial [Bacteroidetes bacterium]